MQTVFLMDNLACGSIDALYISQYMLHLNSPLTYHGVSWGKILPENI